MLLLLLLLPLSTSLVEGSVFDKSTTVSISARFVKRPVVNSLENGIHEHEAKSQNIAHPLRALSINPKSISPSFAFVLPMDSFVLSVSRTGLAGNISEHSNYKYPPTSRICTQKKNVAMRWPRFSLSIPSTSTSRPDRADPTLL